MLKMYAWIKALRLSRLLLGVVCFLLAWLGSLPFIRLEWLRLAVALPGGLLIGHSLGKWLADKRLLFVREQYKWLLEHLLSRLSAGATLENAFMDAPDSLGLLLGKKSDLQLCLNRIKSQLSSRRPLDLLLPELIRCLPCPEARSCLNILPCLRQSGGNICHFVRQQLRLIADQLILLGDLKSETIQRQTEATILAVMPFGIAALLDQTNGLYGSSEVSLMISLGMMLSYMLALTAFILTLSSISFARFKRNRRGLQIVNLRILNTRLMCLCGQFFFSLYKNHLPQIYGSRLLQLLKDQSCLIDQSEEFLMDNFFRTKTVCLLAGLLPCCLAIIIDPAMIFWAVLLPIAFGLLQDQRVFALASKDHQENKLDYPVFLNVTATLLQAGISLHRSLEIGLASFRQQPIGSRLQHDLSATGRKIQHGLPAARVLEEVAAKSSIPEVQSALLMMVRYDREGRSENLQLLEMQIAACWSLHRNAMQKQLEMQSLRLLLPMTLDLAAIMLIVILPAVQSLQTI